jgi:hypothetical protein
MLKLKNPYISVSYESVPSFGGSQRMAESNILKASGCGLVAAMDLLLYLTKNNGYFADSGIKALSLYETIPYDSYNRCLRKLARSYFPVIPYHGMNGLGLMIGMQIYFSKHKLPYVCHWCISDKGIWDKVYHMLKDDIPVIMAIGPNFPFVWRNGKAVLYTKDNFGKLKPASSVKAHFITITGIDDEWIEISSWGRCYYLNRRMYEEYVSKYSAALVSNILYVRKKNKT